MKRQAMLMVLAVMTGVGASVGGLVSVDGVGLDAGMGQAMPAFDLGLAEAVGDWGCGVADPWLVWEGAESADGARLEGDSPLPGSRALFLVGLATLGAMQAGRVVRAVHWSDAPAWLHVGAPEQVGFSYAYDMGGREPGPCVLEGFVSAAGCGFGWLADVLGWSVPRQCVVQDRKSVV